jgi:putative FmdB family regulatory protein
MPIYEYACIKCNKAVELIHKHDDTPNVECESCGKSMDKQIGLTTFRLKGGGWGPTNKKHHFDTPLD